MVFLPVFFHVFFWGNPGIGAEMREGKNVCFHWAFGAMVGPENDRKLIPITRDTTLKTGDKLKLLVVLQKKCFIYLIHRSGQDEISLLFPYDLGQFGTDYETLKTYYIPRGDKWFELDEKVGIERFYLLASAQRFHELEELYNQYVTVGPLKRRELANRIFLEIRKIKRRHKKLTTTVERPITIGGNLRGVSEEKGEHLPDIASISREIFSVNFYSRTFTIDHR